MSEWQPIDTAPRDGTLVLLDGGVWGDEWLESAPRVGIARWVDLGPPYKPFWAVAVHEAGYSVTEYERPTRWMPLPAPPTGETDE